ncbi:MAG: hypothetical protein LKK24_07755 [Leuconostoc mesenteroides]|jgi:hypothetical protein|uniref:hypothetical protein n=1 Tax=Leuconostoc TaxID=1243 RepID=UPI0021A7CD15|nr:hypothetical protein [Leuconostoc mesenteroides]MCI2120961.1 hypothetical protein [Leuconostoc mesenteroides]MCT3053797.1 hypothetical protein [Leuconostoc mesenteroides]
MKKTDVINELNKANSTTQFEFVGFGITKSFTAWKISNKELSLNAFITNLFNVSINSVLEFRDLINLMDDNFNLIRNPENGTAGVFPGFSSVEYDSKNNTIQFS